LPTISFEQAIPKRNVKQDIQDAPEDELESANTKG
jgi:hypothetical protein